VRLSSAIALMVVGPTREGLGVRVSAARQVSMNKPANSNSLCMSRPHRSVDQLARAVRNVTYRLRTAPNPRALPFVLLLVSWSHSCS
jgi:hypothetical protein